MSEERLALEVARKLAFVPMSLRNREDRERLAHIADLEFQEEYEDALAEAATIRLQRALEYGEEHYRDITAEDYAVMEGVYWDIRRKYNRLRTLFSTWKTSPREGLRDALLDIANYALMGVQLLDRYHQYKHRPETFHSLSEVAAVRED